MKAMTLTQGRIPQRLLTVHIFQKAKRTFIPKLAHYIFVEILILKTKDNPFISVNVISILIDKGSRKY